MAEVTRRALVIIPTYDEIESLPGVIERLHQAVPAADVLVVDDASPDGTGQWVDQEAEHNPQIHALHRTGKLGLGTAYLEGFAWGLERGYEVLVEMDADGSHRPEQLPLLLRAVDQGADLAIGSRWVKGGKLVNWPKRRELLSRGGNLYVRLMLGLRVKDATAGYRAFRRELLECLDLSGVESRGYAFQVDMTRRVVAAGAHVIEVPITFVEREFGQPKMSGSIVREAMWLVTKWGWRKRLASLRREKPTN